MAPGTLESFAAGPMAAGETARAGVLAALSARQRGAVKALPQVEPLLLLMQRTSFGIREQELAAAHGMGFEGWLEHQLDPGAIEVGALEATIARALPTTAMSVPELVAHVRASGQPQQPAAEIIAATLLRQLFSGRQLYEVMVEFWSNHFSVYLPDGNLRLFKATEDRDAIRPHALGRFRDLLHASARSPAMLSYLDNFANVAEGPNENYARELLELHTLGVDGGYTENDVLEVARAFTGWTIDPRPGREGLFLFAPRRHDFAAKRVLGTTLPAGQGMEDGEQVLDLLAAHPSTARFVATKLVRRFVSDAPPAALVDAVAATYTRTDGQVPDMLRTIFRSAEFAASQDAKFRRPVEFVLGALRTTGAVVQGAGVRAIADALGTLAQLPFYWPAPNGYPDVQGYWLNASALLERWNRGFALAEQRFAPQVRLSESALARGAWTPEALVDSLAARILHRPLDPADRALLVAFAAGDGSPARRYGKEERERAVTALLGVLLASDYFQYR